MKVTHSSHRVFQRLFEVTASTTAYNFDFPLAHRQGYSVGSSPGMDTSDNLHEIVRLQKSANIITTNYESLVGDALRVVQFPHLSRAEEDLFALGNATMGALLKEAVHQRAQKKARLKVLSAEHSAVQQEILKLTHELDDLIDCNVKTSKKRRLRQLLRLRVKIENESLDVTLALAGIRSL